MEIKRDTHATEEEIGMIKQKLLGLLNTAPYDAHRFIYRIQTEQVTKVLRGEEIWVTYAIIDQENHKTPNLDHPEEKRKDILNEFLKLKKIYERPTRGMGESSIVVFQTKLDRVLVLSSSLERTNGSRVTVWNLVRVNPGEENQYEWLPEGYFDSQTESQRATH